MVQGTLIAANAFCVAVNFTSHPVLAAFNAFTMLCLILTNGRK
jgi:hypothetical protein